MEDFIRNLLNNHVTLTWLVIIIGYCAISYLPRRLQSNRSND